MTRTRNALTLGMLWLGGMGASALLYAQSANIDIDQAQRIYQQQIASCNNGSLPAPAREACVRSAGSALDRARGGPPSEVEQTTSDGRAVVITPEGMPAPSAGADEVTSRDGRSVIVPPSDGRLTR